MMVRLLMTTILFIVALSSLLATAEAGRGSSWDDREGFGYKSTREEILATRDSRRERLVSMIRDLDVQLEDHSSGRRRLYDADASKLEKRARAYKMKLEMLQGDLDDRDVDRILAREEIQAEIHRARRSRGREL
jgi:hypothetical protein